MYNMHQDTLTQFNELFTIYIPTWVSFPSNVHVANKGIFLQWLQSDEIICAKFNNGKYNIWKTNDILLQSTHYSEIMHICEFLLFLDLILLNHDLFSVHNTFIFTMLNAL